MSLHLASMISALKIHFVFLKIHFRTASHQRHTSVTPTSHQRHTSVTPASHKRYTSVTPASHQPASRQRRTSVAPASHQRRISIKFDFVWEQIQVKLVHGILFW